MARIIVGSWMVRYPLGGNLSWTLQWLRGFHQLGHEVYLVEKAGYQNSCFEPIKNVMSDDCAHGVKVVRALLSRFGLGDRFCYVDAQGAYLGLSKEAIREVFRSAVVFVDIGSHGSWLEEADQRPVTVLVDGEPGSTQMKMVQRIRNGEALPDYDYYFSNGLNIGTPLSSAPTAGKSWRPIFNPVVPELFDSPQPNSGAPFSTVMNWQAHDPILYKGRTYGMKDVEFYKFERLPKLVQTRLEVAVSGKVPAERLIDAGWCIRNGHEVTATFDSYREYIQASKGEFSVCKNVFVETVSGWFSDRSAAYLASARPVVLQDTGFASHLPVGRGLFACKTVEEAGAAIEEIQSAYALHSRWAREIAHEYLSAKQVLSGLLEIILI